MNEIINVFFCVVRSGGVFIPKIYYECLVHFFSDEFEEVLHVEKFNEVNPLVAFKRISNLIKSKSFLRLGGLSIIAKVDNNVSEQ